MSFQFNISSAVAAQVAATQQCRVFLSRPGLAASRSLTEHGGSALCSACRSLSQNGHGRDVQDCADLGCELMPTAAITPEQNAVCERHGGIWKTHARRLLDEFSVKFVPEQLHRVTWLTAAVTWACNSAIDDSGFSPAQWVLGRGLRLPYTLLDQTGRLSLRERVTRDGAFSERIAMM